MESTQITAPSAGGSAGPVSSPARSSRPTRRSWRPSSTDAMLVEFHLDTTGPETRAGDQARRRGPALHRPGPPDRPAGGGHAGRQGFSAPSVIESTDSRIDPAAGTLRCRAAIPNTDGLLLPGLFVRLRMPLPSCRALMLPGTPVNTDVLGHSKPGLRHIRCSWQSETNKLMRSG